MRPATAQGNNIQPAGIDQQAVNALNHLSDDEKLKVLDYLKVLMSLSNDQHGSKQKILAESGRLR